jgi:hypothetical protein
MKIRAPFSIEAALIRVLDKLGVQEAAQIVGKSESLLRKASDPDHHYCLSLEDAILLDHAFRLQGHGEPPISTAYTEILNVMELASDRERRNSSPLVGLAIIMEEIGDVARETHKVTFDGKITKHEAATVAKSIDDAVASLMLLKRSISKH